VKFFFFGVFFITLNSLCGFSVIQQSLLRSLGYASIAGASMLVDNNSTIPNKLDKRDIFSLDQEFMNLYHSNTALQSDILLTSMILGNAVLFTQQNEMEEFVYFGELLLLQNSLGQWTKKLSNRYRPYMYSNSNLSSRLKEDGRNSFYSMHTSLAFTSATYLMDKIEDKKLLWGTILYGSAATVGVLRIASGKHFVTDVTVGGVVGYSVTSLFLKQKQNKNLQFYFGIDTLMVKYMF
jgi:undecaprenyl-diphosphatase